MKDDDDISFGAVLMAGFGAIALLLATAYFFGAFDRIVGREFAKFDEETRRQVQEESRAYQEGMAQNLDRLCLEWERTGNVAVARSIRHRAAGFNGDLPNHVQACVNLARKTK